MLQFSTENLRSPAALARFVLTTAAGLGADLWTKRLAEAHLKDTGNSVGFIPRLVQFDYTENHGAVFGIGQGQRGLFVVVSVLAIAFLGFLFATSGRQRVYQVILGMLLAGVLGNLYDRATYGYVRDMIHAFPNTGVFPWIFNVADSLLCVGVALMLGYSFVAGRSGSDNGPGGSAATSIGAVTEPAIRADPPDAAAHARTTPASSPGSRGTPQD